MAEFLQLPFFRFVLDSHNLLCPSLFHNFCFNFGTFNCRIANFHAFFITNKKDLVK